MKKTYEVLKDFKGSPDGFNVIEFKKGQDDVELNDELAKVALEEKWVKHSKAGEKEARAKAKADAERLAAEELAAAQRESAIEALQQEMAALEEEGKAALQTDPSGETAKPIQEQWQTKRNELAALLA